MDYTMNPKKRRNAEGLIFNLKGNPQATPKAMNKAIDDAIRTANANETFHNLAQKIGVVYEDGTTKLITLQEFNNGSRF